MDEHEQRKRSSLLDHFRCQDDVAYQVQGQGRAAYKILRDHRYSGWKVWGHGCSELARVLAK